MLDADALNILAEDPDGFDLGPAAVLTPHPGEAARLLGRDMGERVADAEAVGGALPRGSRAEGGGDRGL